MKALINYSKRFFRPMTQIPGLYAKMIAYVIFWQIYAFANIALIKYITESLETHNLPGFTTILLLFCLFIVLFFILGRVIRYRHYAQWQSARLVIHHKCFSQFLQLDNNYTESIGTWKSINILQTGIDSRTDGIMNVCNNGIKLLFSFVVGSYFARQIHPRATLIFIVLFLSVAILIYYTNRKVVYHRDKRRDAKKLYTHQAVKMIMSKSEILLSDKIDKEIEVLDKHNNEEWYHNIGVNHYLFFVFTFPRGAISLLRIAVYMVIWYGYLSWHYSLSILSSLLGLLILFDAVIIDVVEFYKNFTKNISEINNLRELFDKTPLMDWYDTGDTFVYQTWHIQIKDICYSYTSEHTVFANLSLTIEWGQKVALVGSSWSGKSTLVKLITGYIRPQSWTIAIDGQDLRKCSLKTLYRHIGYLTQEPSVFDGTIRENLSYGCDQEPTNDELHEAIANAHCDFIHQLPQRLDTHIGEKGIKLSGGQRQRLAIAKLFLKNPDIIILDEPTSALDSISEKHITDALQKLFYQKTVIIIAHRLQTVRQADEIIVLDHGHIMERWHHRTLATAWWPYQTMLELQSGFVG